MINEYIKVPAFLLVGLIFAVSGLLISYLAASRNKTKLKSTTYECGMEPVGSSWIQFNIRFYLFALIYIIFDVEVLYLYPWAVSFKTLGLAGFVEMLVFMLILLVGLAYAWRKGVLKW